MSALDVQGVVYRYSDGTAAVKGVDFLVPDGEFLCLLGASGSGKSTLLRIIAGYLDPQEGRVALGDREIGRLPPRDRGIGMVFQNYALFPHMTVFENVAFGLRARRTPGKLIRQRVAHALESVKMDSLQKRRPFELSGGQQQRVALARAIVVRPQVLLMDEPLSALDVGLRAEMQSQIRNVQQEHGITTVYVTHDQHEAFSLADKIVLLHDGAKVDEGPPERVLLEPRSLYSAEYAGHSAILRVRHCELRDTTLQVEIEGQRVTLEVPCDPGAETLPRYVGVRPGALRIKGPGASPERHLRGRVSGRSFDGRNVLVRVALGESHVEVPAGGERYVTGQDVLLGWQSDGVFILREDNHHA